MTTRPRPRFAVVPTFQVARGQGWRPTPVDPHSEIVDRALREVSPSQSMEESCRKKIAKAIEMEPIESYNLTNDAVVTWHAFPDRNERRALKRLVALLDMLEKVIGSLPPHWQQVLVKKPAELTGTRIVSDKVEIDGAGTGLCWPAAAERVEIFCNELARLGERADAFAALDRAGFVAGPAESAPRADVRKRHAANCAYDLLTTFGNQPPTLKSEGAFYNLAQIMYEAFTGEPEQSIERACRAVHQARRRKR
jgi:hypothetical protein